jgi:RNA polymerase sigma factor (TIGR02999 family)
MSLVDPQEKILQILAEWTKNRGSTDAELLEMFYAELRQIARALMRGERPDHTLQTAALANEAYIRLCQGSPENWASVKHLLCAMAQTMRRILVDHARARGRQKRGGDQLRPEAASTLAAAESNADQLIAVDEALRALARRDERQAAVVTLRFFAGLTVDEVAAILQVSPETVKLDWRSAKAWLEHELK